MRIGFFTDAYLPEMYGMQISVEMFRREFERLGHTVFVHAPYTPGYTGSVPQVTWFWAIRALRKPDMRLAAPIVRNGTLYSVIHRQLDVIHAHSPFTMGLLAVYIARRRGIPLIYTHHTDYPKYAKAYYGGGKLLQMVARSLGAFFANRADAVIAPSFKIKKALQRAGVRTPITIVPTGVDLQLFQISDDARDAANRVRDRYGIPPKNKLLLFVGRMGKEKNIDFLLRAYAAIAQQRTDISFLLVGDGPHLPALQALAKRLHLNNSIFTGTIPHEQLPAYYQAADVFIFASLTETQGMVLLEAMASSVPVVTLRDDAFRGIVAHRVNGIVVDRSSPESFARAVSRLLADVRLLRRCAVGALHTAERFSEELQAKKMIAVYRNSIRKNFGRQ